MLKSLKDIKSEDIKYAEGKRVCIQEKVDMPHIWIRLQNGEAILLHDRKPVNDVDRILDSTYNEIYDDLITMFLDKETVDKVTDFTGPCEIKVFYMLNEQPLHINYRNLYKQAFHYFISDIWFIDGTDKKDKRFDYIDKIVDTVNCPLMRSLNMYVTDWDESFTEKVNSYCKDQITLFELTNHAPTISHYNYISTLGFVIKAGDCIWQQVNKEFLGWSEGEKKAHAETRKEVLSDFIEKVLSDKEFMNSLPLFIDGRKEKKYSEERIYIDVMQRAFLQYVNSSDFIKEKNFKPEDLMPLHVGTTGNLDMSLVTNDNVYVICQFNPLMQELLRLLIHTFYRIKSYTFYSFNEFETKKISDFMMLFS